MDLSLTAPALYDLVDLHRLPCGARCFQPHAKVLASLADIWRILQYQQWDYLGHRFPGHGGQEQCKLCLYRFPQYVWVVVEGLGLHPFNVRSYLRALWNGWRDAS